MYYLTIYTISPFDWDKQRAFGFFRFKACEEIGCGCGRNSGWGFNLFLVGFSVEKVMIERHAR